MQDKSCVMCLFGDGHISIWSSPSLAILLLDGSPSPSFKAMSFYSLAIGPRICNVFMC